MPIDPVKVPGYITLTHTPVEGMVTEVGPGDGVAVVTLVGTVVSFGVVVVGTGVVLAGADTFAPGAVCPVPRFAAIISPAMNARITTTTSTIGSLPGFFDDGAESTGGCEEGG